MKKTRITWTKEKVKEHVESKGLILKKIYYAGRHKRIIYIDKNKYKYDIEFFHYWQIKEIPKILNNAIFGEG